jgi:hypothetical protein
MQTSVDDALRKKVFTFAEIRKHGHPTGCYWDWHCSFDSLDDLATTLFRPHSVFLSEGLITLPSPSVRPE